MKQNHKSGPNEIRWLPFQNVSGEAVPAFALIRVSAADYKGLLTGNKPNQDGQFVYLNGPASVPNNGYGACTRDFPSVAAYDTADGTPANGETWGAGNASWKLRKNKAGFRIEGGVRSNPDRCLVRNEDTFAPISTVTAGSGVSVGNMTVVPVPWSGTDSLFWSSAQNTRFTIPAGYTNAKFFLCASGRFSATDVQKDYGCGWFLNGDRTVGAFDAGGPCSGGPLKLAQHQPLTLSANDYVEFCVYHNDSASRTFTGIAAMIEAKG